MFEKINYICSKHGLENWELYDGITYYMGYFLTCTDSSEALCAVIIDAFTFVDNIACTNKHDAYFPNSAEVPEETSKSIKRRTYCIPVPNEKQKTLYKLSNEPHFDIIWYEFRDIKVFLRHLKMEVGAQARNDKQINDMFVYKKITNV